jgi:insertion element IS1 protein InsB
MALISGLCPYCQSDQVVKRGKSTDGKQRYLCKNASCAYGSFRLEYAYKGRLPKIKQQILELAMNGRGIRETARVLEISPTTVLKELKKNKKSTPISGDTKSGKRMRKKSLGDTC